MTAWRHFIEKLPGVIGTKDGHAFVLGHTATLPTCEARREGEERMVRGTAGVATRRVICVKNAADAYAWGDTLAGAASAAQSATIASGVVTVSGPGVTLLTVDTEAAAASDDLVTINGGTAGHRITLVAANTARTVVVKSTGNIDLSTAGGDFDLDSNVDTITLVYSAAASMWLETSRSANG